VPFRFQTPKLWRRGLREFGLSEGFYQPSSGGHHRWTAGEGRRSSRSTDLNLDDLDRTQSGDVRSMRSFPHVVRPIRLAPA
jgi:hypothetical protein